MAQSVFTNRQSVVHKSSMQGKSVSNFPDVCKTPWQGPVPIPYPNQASAASSAKTVSKAMATGYRVSSAPISAKTAADTSFQAAHQKGVNAQQLRAQLQTLHTQILGLSGGNPDRWHQLVDNYVIATAELYMTLTDS